jgi:transcriptional regulator with XRE-family HTH domain
MKSHEEKQLSTPLLSKRSLLRRLSLGPRARAKFVESHLNKGLAFQIRAMRDLEELSQEELSRRVRMTQNAISRLENPKYGRATISTLKRLAAALDVALIVRFVPFSQLVDWVSGTPFVDKGLSPEALAVPSFDREMRIGSLGQISQIKQTWQQQLGSVIETPYFASKKPAAIVNFAQL